MSTCPIPCLESSSTPSHMPKPNVRKIQFSKQKVFVLENLLPSFDKYFGQPSEMNCWVILRNSHGSASEMNYWTTLQGNYSENLPQNSFHNHFYFSFIFMSCTHTYHSRVPRCIWNALCHFQTIHANIFYMHILTKFNPHTSCYSIHGNNIKISSHGLITIQEIHFESPKQHKNHTQIT